jgi:Protein of unknown function (DUF2934)
MNEDKTSLIRIRAYQFFLQREGAPGDAVRDWLRAEQEIREEESLHRGPARISDRMHHGRLTHEDGCDIENPT